jgi:hypothetical protein
LQVAKPNIGRDIAHTVANAVVIIVGYCFGFGFG